MQYLGESLNMNVSSTEGGLHQNGKKDKDMRTSKERERAGRLRDIDNKCTCIDIASLHPNT